MSNRYQRSLEQVRAPRELVERTKAQVRKGGRVVPFPLWRSVSAAAEVLVAALALFWNSNRSPVFAVLPAQASEEAPGSQFGLIDHERRKVTAEEFDEAFGTALSGLELQDFSAWLTRDLEGNAETGGASFRYLGCTVRGKTGGDALLSEDLAAVEPQKLWGVQVRLARREDGVQLLAGFTQNGVEWLVTGGDVAEQEFLQAVSQLAEMGKGAEE